MTVHDGFGLRIVDRGESDPRMRYYRFATGAIGWNPGVNVLLPTDYHTSGYRYPVLYLLHGGLEDFTTRDIPGPDGIRAMTDRKPIIVVMPDGGHAGWYSNPVSSLAGPRNWETFHMGQLRPWIDANFRTYDEYDGRAIAGFSMGGFGALKYAAKYFGHFASVSSYSGPASLRDESSIITHWANISSAAIELFGGTVYGFPFWDQARVSADNPVEGVQSYRHKRSFWWRGRRRNCSICSASPTNPSVLPSQRAFRVAASTQDRIPYDARERTRGDTSSARTCSERISPRSSCD